MFAHVIRFFRVIASFFFPPLESPASARPSLKQVLPLAVWIAWVLNFPTFWARATSAWGAAPGPWLYLGPLAEMLMALGATLLILVLAQSLGRRALRLTSVTLLLVSAACSYYMSRFKIVIGFGVLNAVFTTDHDLSGEIVGVWTIVWLLLLGLLPAIWFWRRKHAAGVFHGWRHGHWWGRQVLALLGAALLVGCGQTLLEHARRDIRREGGPDTNPVGTAAHSYVPSNWIVGSGMVLANRFMQAQDEARLKMPAKTYHFLPSASLEDSVVVLVIGETTRSDRLGILGHDRNTTPWLAKEKHVAAFRGWSCDTATKLSLLCMFVRPEGIIPGQGAAPDKILEDNVFSVYKHLGFGIELFAMQSEAGFYSKVRPDLLKLREEIAAQPENAERRLDDGLLVPEVRDSLARHPKRPLLIVLHTKGSHAMYSQRYPANFAVWQPECLSSDDFCKVSELLNAFDNSVLYIDHVLNELRNTLRGRKALMVFAPDHGESIDENHHFHATPRHVAPPEQRRVPLVFWASDRWLADPVLGRRYERLEQKAQAARALPMDDPAYGHHNLFASMLGCIGVDSGDGGISAKQDLCH